MLKMNYYNSEYYIIMPYIMVIKTFESMPIYRRTVCISVLYKYYISELKSTCCYK